MEKYNAQEILVLQIANNMKIKVHKPIKNYTIPLATTKSPPFFVHYPEYYSGHPCVPATCCVFASDLAKFSPLFFRYRWLLCSRGSAREISSPLNLKL